MKNTFGKIPNWLLVVVSLIILASSIYAMVRITPRFLGTIGLQPVGEERITAPDFALLDLDGREVTLSDFRGKKVIVTFWTTWNEISVEQLKVLDSYSQGQDSIVVLAVNSQEDSGVVGEVVEQSSIRVPILLDGDGEAGELYKIGVLPLTVFLDTNGFESERFIGFIPIQTIQDAVDRL